RAYRSRSRPGASSRPISSRRAAIRSAELRHRVVSVSRVSTMTSVRIGGGYALAQIAALRLRETAPYLLSGGVSVRVSGQCSNGHTYETVAPEGNNGRPRSTWRGACPTCGVHMVCTRIPGQTQAHAHM